MKQRRSWLLYATLIGGLSLSACGSSPDDTTPPDDVDTGDTSDTGDTGDVGDTGDTGDPDTGEVEPGDGLVGSSCVDDGEASSQQNARSPLISLRSRQYVTYSASIRRMPNKL